MTWGATGVTVGAALRSVWAGQKAGKEQAARAKKRGAMITELAHRNIKQRNLVSRQAKFDVLEQGAQAQQSAYLQSTQDIASTESEASGSGAIISGTVKDLTRSKANQGDRIQVAIAQYTNKNIESITRDTKAQNEAELYAAQQGQAMANAEAHSIHRANQRQFVSGILQTVASGYQAKTARNKAGTGRYKDKAFWEKDFASWEQIKSGDWHV